MGLCRKSRQQESRQRHASLFARGESRSGPDGADAACRIGTEHGTVHRVATQLGYGVESVRMWGKQADVDDGHVAGVTTAEARRVRELEQEVREFAACERDIEEGSEFLRGGA